MRILCYPPIHPGKILLKEFIEELGLNQHRVALAIGVHPRRINEIVLGKRGITAETALKLASFFGNSAEFWMRLQARYEIQREKDRLKNRSRVSER